MYKIYFQILCSYAAAIALIIFGTKIAYSLLSDRIENKVVRGLASVAIVDVLANVAQVLVNEVFSICSGNGFSSIKLNAEYIPCVGRIIGIVNSCKNLKLWISFGHKPFVILIVLGTILSVIYTIIMICLIVKYCFKEISIEPTVINTSVKQKTFVKKQASLNALDELKKFKQLLDNGAITQEEFDKIKKDTLGL